MGSVEPEILADIPHVNVSNATSNGHTDGSPQFHNNGGNLLHDDAMETDGPSGEPVAEQASGNVPKDTPNDTQINHVTTDKVSHEQNGHAQNDASHNTSTQNVLDDKRDNIQNDHTSSAQTPNGHTSNEHTTNDPSHSHSNDNVAQNHTSNTPTPDTETFSWQKPHINFVAVLVGPDEVPFGIQLDFLCTKSAFYRRHFARPENAATAIEAVVRIPDCSPRVFGLVQNYMYAGGVYSEGSQLPGYDVLFGAWKLGHNLEIDGLCDNAIQAMKELRRTTQRVPATPLLVEVWRDTPKGSSIRSLLLEWTSEYMRASSSREQFATELPHGVLTELVVKMANDPLFDSGGEPPAPPAPPMSPTKSTTNTTTPATANGRVKNVHYLSDDSGDELTSRSRRALKRQSTGSALLPHGHPGIVSRVARKSDGDLLQQSKPGPKPGVLKTGKRGPNVIIRDPSMFTTAQKLSFCQDLISRMLSGPGFWTRLVGPFKQPVDPSADGVPDYRDKVKNPMDLFTIKQRMDAGEYRDELAFLADIRLIFTNCYAYWKKGDAMWAACERLEKTFEDKYAQMARWISKMEGQEE